jgi:hypothetical protein
VRRHRAHLLREDVDCGGEECGSIEEACALTNKCEGNSDCASSICDATPAQPICVGCADTTKNGAETDADCSGGTCAHCAHTKICDAAADRASIQRTAGVCTSCFNGAVVTQGTASSPELDCGGTSRDLRCPIGPIGQGCLIDADCASDKCNDGNKLGRALTLDGTCTDLARTTSRPAWSAVCRGMVCTSCSNSLLDDGETAADYGGAGCEGCPSGSACFPPPPLPSWEQ